MLKKNYSWKQLKKHDILCEDQNNKIIIKCKKTSKNYTFKSEETYVFAFNLYDINIFRVCKKVWKNTHQIQFDLKVIKKKIKNNNRHRSYPCTLKLKINSTKHITVTPSVVAGDKLLHVSNDYRTFDENWTVENFQTT